MLDQAEAAGVTLAIEPFHPVFLAERSAIVRLAQANRLVEEIAHPLVKIATGFDGPLEVEVLNRGVWARPAEEVVIDIGRRMTGILASLQDAR